MWRTAVLLLLMMVCKLQTRSRFLLNRAASHSEFGSTGSRTNLSNNRKATKEIYSLLPAVFKNPPSSLSQCLHLCNNSHFTTAIATQLSSRQPFREGYIWRHLNNQISLVWPCPHHKKPAEVLPQRRPPSLTPVLHAAESKGKVGQGSLLPLSMNVGWSFER